MKSLLLLPVLALVILASSCRTFPPLDPPTFKHAYQCLPGDVAIEATK